MFNILYSKIIENQTEVVLDFKLLDSLVAKIFYSLFAFIICRLITIPNAGFVAIFISVITIQVYNIFLILI